MVHEIQTCQTRVQKHLFYSAVNLLLNTLTVSPNTRVNSECELSLSGYFGGQLLCVMSAGPSSCLCPLPRSVSASPPLLYSTDPGKPPSHCLHIFIDSFSKLTVNAVGRSLFYYFCLPSFTGLLSDFSFFFSTLIYPSAVFTH